RSVAGNARAAYGRGTGHDARRGRDLEGVAEKPVRPRLSEGRVVRARRLRRDARQRLATRRAPGGAVRPVLPGEWGLPAAHRPALSLRRYPGQLDAGDRVGIRASPGPVRPGAEGGHRGAVVGLAPRRGSALPGPHRTRSHPAPWT